jgi:hypothetical protein
MRRLRALLIRLAGLFRKERQEREVSSELESHLQLHIEDNLRAGMSPTEARRSALIKLGGVEQTKESYRERRGLPVLETLAQDIRFSVRTLGRNPGFTTVAVLTLALGVGANTALFSVVKAVLLNSLPYRQPDRLVTVARGDSQTPNPTNVSFGETEDWKGRARSLHQIALYRMDAIVLGQQRSGDGFRFASHSELLRNAWHFSLSRPWVSARGGPSRQVACRLA